MYIDVYLNHFAVEQKLTQHCKSTILQQKEILIKKKEIMCNKNIDSSIRQKHILILSK